jgi:hypothetical protein
MRDFREGLDLYALGRGNPNLKRLFMLKGPTAYNTEKLEYELRHLLHRLSPQTPVNQKPEPVQATPTESLASILAKLQEERKVLLQEAAHLHSRLDMEQNDHTRNEACEIIYYHGLRINQIHRILNHAADKKELLHEKPIRRPETKTETDYDALKEAELIRTLNNLRSRVSKNKHNPARLADIRTRLEQVEKLLERFSS